MSSPQSMSRPLTQQAKVQTLTRFLLSGFIAFLFIFGSLSLGSARASWLFQECLKTEDPSYKPCTEEPKPTETPTEKPTSVPPSDTSKPTDLGAPTDTLKPTVLGQTATPSFTSTFTFTPTASRTLTPTRTYTATLPGGDIWVLGIEVTQAIQVYPGNTIPLLGYKPTVVRVYVQGSGTTWTDVTARLTVTGGGVTGRVLLPRTSSPSNIITVDPAGSHRTILTDSFNFLLPSDLTAVGERDLQVRIYSLSGRPETNTTNNNATLTIKFNPVVYATVYGVNYGNDGTDTSSPRATPAPWTDMELHRRYAENVMPVTQFFVGPFPGVGTAGRYFRNLDAARAWADMMLSRSMYSTARIYLLQPEGTCLCGFASGRRMNGQNLTSSPGFGATMAQEVSHTYAAWWHAVSLAHPADLADSAFPYPHSSVGTQVGFDTNAFMPVPPTLGSGHTHDYMGYGNPPTWTSPYTYCRMIDVLAGGRFSCPASARSAANAIFVRVSPNNGTNGLALVSRQKEDTFIYIAGMLNPDGTARFEPFFQQSATTDLSSPLEGDRYQLRFVDDAGELLSGYPFEPLVTHPDPDHALLFSLTIPYPSETAKIQLSEGETVLAEREVSLSKPIVSQVAVGSGELTGPQIVSWQASDADSDTLTYLVEYSPDNGGHWIPIDAYLTETFVTIDFDSLPGGDQARLRVVASDGVNTSESVSDHSFSIRSHSPQITLLQPLDGASYFETQPFYVSAQAFDWEDGQIEDMDRYVWSSDVDGQLSTGSWTALVELSPGNHTLTVQVTDSDSNISQQSAHITIMAADQEVVQPTPIPAGLPSWLPFAGLGLLGVGSLVILLRRRRR